MANNTQDTFAELRRDHFDGSDPFMTGGHQILRERQRPKQVLALWAKSNDRVQALLLLVFPKMKTDLLERERAGRWVRIIHLYLRLGLTYGQVAGEMGISRERVHDTIKSIYRAAAGRQTNNRLRGQRPEGKAGHTSSLVGTSLGSLSGSIHVRFSGSSLYRTNQGRRRAIRTTSAKVSLQEVRRHYRSYLDGQERRG